MKSEPLLHAPDPRTVRLFAVRALETFLVLAALAWLLAYVIGPLYEDRAAAEPSSQKEDYLLDCFILRDASKSLDAKSRAVYRDLEQQLLKHLRTKAGDRISYAQFGGSTVPERIQPPASDRAGIDKQVAEANRQPSQFDSTDFAMLFEQLHEAITLDRESQVAVEREAHADAIVILTDGIHDPEPRNRRCPDPSNEEFIPDDVVEAYGELIGGPYVRSEPIHVRLILVGTPDGCGPAIRREWERRLGRRGLRVVFHPELPESSDLGEALLMPLRNHPHVSLRLRPLEEAERQKLDSGERFSVEYGAQSVQMGGRLRIESASLINDEGEILELNAFRNSRILSTHPNHRPVLDVPSPTDGEILGPVITGEELHLEPADPHRARAFLRESEDYRIEPKVILEPSGVGTPPIVEADSLEVKPCQKAVNRAKIRDRLEIPALLSLVLAGTFMTGVGLWVATHGRQSSTCKWLNHRLSRVVIWHYARWVWYFVVLLVPLAIGVLCLSTSIPILLSLAGLVLVLCLFFLRAVRESPWASVTVRTIEFGALPLFVEAAASFLF